MAQYRVTGIWKSNGVITHYILFQRIKSPHNNTYTPGPAVKMTKAAAVDLIEREGNSAKTYLWNYNTSSWVAGGDITIVSSNPKYLRTVHDGTTRDNLSHLPDFSHV